MAYRVLENIDERMIRAILQIGAEEGVQKVSAKRIADRCDISTFTVFEHFGNMRGALDAAAIYFDRLHMAEVTKMAEQKMNASQVWDQMMESFLKDPDGTLYYISYTNVLGFDPTEENPRAAEFLKIARTLFRVEDGISDEDCLLLWDYITSMAFYYAEKFIHFLPPTDENKARVKHIVFDGLNAVTRE